MAENLNYEVTGSKCLYDDSKNCSKFGRLYDWVTAMQISNDYYNANYSTTNNNHQGVCPKGWHIPTFNDWCILMSLIGYVYNTDNHLLTSTEGNKLKATSGWVNSGSGSDDFGFSALPSTPSSFYNNVEENGVWWSSIDGYSKEGDLAYQCLVKSDENVQCSPNKKTSFNSVRCVKD